MQFKMRVLFHSPSGNTEIIGQQIARGLKTTSDKIPPAYPVENEKLIFLCVEANGAHADKNVVDFCTNLSVQRSKNVALLLVSKGGDESVKELCSLIQKSGVAVHDSIHIIKVGGLFKQSKVKQEEIAAAIAWSNKVVGDIAEK